MGSCRISLALRLATGPRQHDPQVPATVQPGGPVTTTELTVASSTIWSTKTYHLIFKPFGWATFYVDDQHGTLAIESDWGNYAYRWGRGQWLGVDPPDLSPDLSRALLQFGSCDYIARKLFRGQDEEYDPDATEREIRVEILRLRRSGTFDRDEARCAMTLVERIDWHDPSAAYSNEELRELIEEPWEYVRRGPTAWFLVMRDQVLPAFLRVLREDLYRNVKVASPEDYAPAGLTNASVVTFDVASSTQRIEGRLPMHYSFDPPLQLPADAQLLVRTEDGVVVGASVKHADGSEVAVDLKRG
jgi:hypothetical protein